MTIKVQHCIRTLVIKYLDVSLPLSRQPNKLLVPTATVKVSEKYRGPRGCAQYWNNMKAVGQLVIS